MGTDNPVAMDDDAVDSFLGAGGTGVISLSTSEGRPPHAVPVSYGYDDATRVLYFRLAAGQGRSKGDLTERPVSFVTHGEADDRWHSVVASGRLEDVERSGIETETLDGLGRVAIPLIDMFDAPTRVVDFEFYRLDPEHLTGRVESPTAE